MLCAIIYAAMYRTINTAGQVTFNLANGTYKFRADYQTNQFWTDDQTIVADQINYINLADGGGNFTLTVKANADPLSGVNCYVFSNEGTYFGLSGITNSNGQYISELSTGDYKIRVDYLGRQFWANIVSGQSSQVEIKEGLATVFAHTSTGPVAGATVYLFSESGSYLGMYAITDTDGYADFTLPAYPFKFRVDVAGAQYWSQVINIIEGVQSAVDVNVE